MYFTKRQALILIIFVLLCGAILFVFLNTSKPTKAASGVVVYDLNSADSSAWYHTHAGAVLSDPDSADWVIYTDDYFSKARHQDEQRNNWSGGIDNTYAHLLYRFKIEENINHINQIDFGWVGYDTLSSGDCFYRYIWNVNTSVWELLGSDCNVQSADQVYVDIINSNFTNYIDNSDYIYFGIAGGWQASCPFIYSFDGQDYYLEDEGYSFAIFRPWQYESFSLLEKLKPINGKYRLKFTEELPEVSWTNHLRLWVVDHPQDTEILPDFAGNLYTISKPIPPNEAVDFKGKDQSQKINQKDDQFWESHIEEQDLSKVSDLYSGLVLTFPVEGKPENAKFILKAMESEFLSASWSKFLSLIGFNNLQFLEKLENDPEWLKRLQNWVMTEGPLQMSIWDGQEWQMVDSLLVGNTEVMQDLLVKIDPALIHGDEIKIKLSGIVTAYQIDYAAMDFSEQVPFEKKEISLLSAQKTSQGKVNNVLNPLTENDDQEVAMQMGDTIDLEFKEEPYNWQFLGRLISEGYAPLAKRSYFLGAHGWYLPEIDKEADLEKNLPIIERLFSLEEGFTARYMLGLEEGETTHHTMYENYLKTDIAYQEPEPSPLLPRTGFLAFLSLDSSFQSSSGFWQKTIEFFKTSTIVRLFFSPFSLLF